MDQNNEPPKIEFEEEKWQRPIRTFHSGTPEIVRLVIKYSGGYIKDEKQATHAILVVVIIAIIFSLFLGGGQTTNSSKDIKILPAEF